MHMGMHMKPIVIAVLCAVAFRASAEEDPPLSPAEEVDNCMGCHHLQDQEIKLSTGEMFSLHIDGKAYAQSSHHKLGCTDCHTDLKGVEGEHPKKALANKREFAIQYSERCKKCHFSNYTDTLDSVHHARVAAGKLDAAVCSDCHGAHNITSASEPRSKISRICATCHAQIAAAYAQSVHGREIAATENEDVPTCTDCHKSHDIADAKAGAWRLKSPELCGKCHADAKLMAKYNLSPDVLQTYLADFHGTTVTLQQGQKGANPVVALCTDCHGVHDITRTKGEGSKVIQANLLATCQKCHPGAKGDFPSSWMSHYEPSLTKAPLVYLIKLAYAFFIPFMIGGLALQLALHLWRLAVNR
jgi:predicted CXXCH cytochrome family protein